MLVAARTSDKAVKTDRFMAKITFEQVNLLQKLTAFFAKTTTMMTKMFPALQASVSVFDTKPFSAYMTLYAALLTYPCPTLSAAFDSTFLAHMLSAATTGF
jgi:hypothetical protein